MISTKLFDKIIDVEFTVEKQEKAEGISFLRSLGTEKLLPPITQISTKKVTFITPRQGIKPKILLNVTCLPAKNISEITLKLTNFYSSIDIALYKYMSIRAGYRDGPTVRFDCQIMNCYIERPNPEGITIFQGVIGVLSDLLDAKKEVFFTLDGDTIDSCLSKIATAAGLTLQKSLPPSWQGINLPFINSTYTFTNALTMRTWLTDMLNSVANNLGLDPLYCSVKGNMLRVYSVGSRGSESPSVILDRISVAYFMSGYIVVKAPWNPLLPINENETCFRMDSRFFRGRIGTLQVGGEKKEFRVYTLKVSFGTYDENEMEIQATDLSVAKGL